jgi:hypothetical protein
MNTPTNSEALPLTNCSPSDYDAGLLNDFGGGDVGWWQDYLRAEIGRANDYWREIHDQQNTLMVRLYNHGYMAGHQDSVESAFVLIHHTDMDTYHADVVAEILQENTHGKLPKTTCRVQAPEIQRDGKGITKAMTAERKGPGRPATGRTVITRSVSMPVESWAEFDRQRGAASRGVWLAKLLAGGTKVRIRPPS